MMVPPVLKSSSSSVQSASALQLMRLQLLLSLLMWMKACGGLYRQQQRLMLSRGVRGYISCPALADPPTTLIVWTKDEVRGQETEVKGQMICNNPTATLIVWTKDGRRLKAT